MRLPAPSNLARAFPRRLPPPEVVVSVIASVGIHAAALAWLGFSGRGPISAEAASGRASETVLTFSEPAQPVVHEPAPPPSEPSPPPPSPVKPAVVAELTTEPAPKVEPARPKPPAPAPVEPPKPATPPPVHQPGPPLVEPAKNTVFAGVQARRAHRVVYVVDGSGPMASSLAFVKGELARSIGALDADQSFQVLFFRESSAESSGFIAFDAGSSSPQLVAASADAKQRFLAWLGTIRPTGRSNPQPALEESLRLGPDLVFVLSRRIKRTNLADAAGEVRQILGSLDRLNPVDRLSGQRPVVIKTIQFLDDDPSGLLQAIGQIHGDGADSYKLLTLGELGR